MSTTDAMTAIEPLDDRGSAVRFEPQCVVIPDHAHHSLLPRVVTRSYALPLWKRRTASTSSSTSTQAEDAAVEDQVVLRVPLPTFTRRPSSSTNRPVDPVTPLPSCLVHRPPPSASVASPGTPPLSRHARSPRKTSPSPSRPDLVMVPLRPCCEACQSITEAALVDGDAWPEHFSRAASRRRSRSIDCSPRTITVSGSAASSSYGGLALAITVDEVDKRRRASDTGPSMSSHQTLWSQSVKDERKPYHFAASSTSSLGDARLPPSPSRTTPAAPGIPEEDDDEDENELFPLPSPKRTPSTSPAPSLTGSMCSLTVAQQNQSSGTSPTHSTCSGDCAPPTKRQFLAPPTYASSSSLSLPKFASESTTDLQVEDPPSPTLLSALPSLSGRQRQRPRSRSPPSSFRKTFVPMDQEDTPPSALDDAPYTSFSAQAATPTTAPIPTSPPHTPPQQHPPSSPPSYFGSPSQTRLPWRSKRSMSSEAALSGVEPSSVSLSSSPTLTTATPGTTPKKPSSSFTMSSPLLMFAGALRGVGSMGM